MAPGGYGGGLMDSRGPMDMDTMPDNSRQVTLGNVLNFHTPKMFAVINLKFKQRCLSIEEFLA